MNMSKQGIYDQLTSSAGDKFSKEDAQYAIDHLKADYKKNALKSAESYQEDMNMSKNAIYEQLISNSGDKFTEKEAQYAIDNLDD
ncbi:surface lipoprotein-related protein [Staphylococcus epidermidis]|nr:surface lipoprotein-related protein [Staphylococcus epidermidis]